MSNKRTGGSLVNRVFSIFMFWALFATFMSSAGLWWGGHYFMERTLQREALDQITHFDEMGTVLYFSEQGNAMERIRQSARRSPDIQRIAYYSAEDMGLVGLYTKSGSAPMAAPQAGEANPDEPMLLMERRLGLISSLRVLAPIRTRAIDPSDLLDVSGDQWPAESANTIGYVTIDMDIQPRRHFLLISMLILNGFMGLIMFAAYWLGGRSIRRALQPLLDLQSPLKQLASGNFNVSVTAGNAADEIATIGSALNATIEALRQQSQEKEAAQLEKVGAEAASHAKSQFLAHMSHEIRTPLNGLLGFIGLLAKTPLNETQTRYLRTCEISSNALLAIINDILDLSKIEAGKLPLVNSGFDLREAFDNCIAMQAPAASNKGLRLDLLFHHDVPRELTGDAPRICQVLSNLIGNAVKFTSTGGIRVEVSLAGETAERAMIAVEVSDTGVGIEEQKQERLFQPFSQAHEFTSRQYGGIGLGLVICKRIVEMMGGEITVRSTVGAGSCFSFTMDLEKRPSQKKVTASVAARVLVVSSRDDVAEALHEDLLAAGVGEQSRATAADTLALLVGAAEQGRAYDAVIFDQAIGNRQAAEFAQSVKADARLAGMHLVLVRDSFSRCNSCSAGRCSSFESCLNWPYSAAELSLVLGRNFAGETAGQSASTVALAQPESRQLHMLVVDDNPINRELSVIMLDAMGIQCDQASDGAAAIRLVRAYGPYDMILMDINMPTMNGEDATVAIRELEEGGRPTPIIALTANALEGDRERFLAAGMDGHLPKPITERGLRAVIHECFPDVALAAEQQMPQVRASNTVIDSRLGVEQAFGSADFWRKAVATLLDELPAALAEIELAFSEHRNEDLRRHVHRLNGTAIHCGTPALQLAGKSLEAACVAAPESIGETLTALKAAAAELTGFIASNGIPEVGSR